MSLNKRRPKNSVNSTISDHSHTDLLNNSAMFKNQVLSEIKNIHVTDVIKSSRKQAISSAKKARVNSKPAESKDTKLYNYSSLTKVVDEKNLIIDKQEKQIQNLKITLERVRKELDLTRVNFQKKKLQDLALLKQQERQNEENLKELDTLKGGLKQMRSKIQNMEIQNLRLTKRNTDYLAENEDLTIKINSLKEQFFSKSTDEKVLSDLKQELHILKEQSKLTKELQNQKNLVEQRCRNFERKINEYVVKYNEVQSSFNDSQIRYYRAEKDNDDLKLTIQDLEIENKNMKKLLEQERCILNQQTEKWNMRLSNLEAKSKGDPEYPDAKFVISELEERCRKLQQSTVFQAKLSEKDVQLNLLQTEQLKLIEELNIREKEIESLKGSQEHSSKMVSSMQETLGAKNKQISELETELARCRQYIVELQSKAADLLAESQRINALFRSTSEEKYLQMEKLSNLSKEWETRALKLEKNSLEQEQMCIKLRQQLCEENSVKESLEKKLDESNRHLHQQLQNLRKESSELAKAQNKISQTNIQLKQIKQAVGQYKGQMEDLNGQLEDAERALRNQEHLMKEQSLKHEEEVAYYKRKYDEIFGQNMQLSDKVCQIQKDSTDQVNKTTVLMKENSSLQDQIKKMEGEMDQHKQQSEQKLKGFDVELENGRGKVYELEAIKEGVKIRLHESEGIRRALQTKIATLEQQTKAQNRRHERQLSDKEQLHQHKMKQMETKWQFQLQQIQKQFSEKELVLTHKYQSALKQAMEKDSIIQNNYEIIGKKENEIQQMQNFKSEIQTQEYNKIKLYNVRLTQQLEEITAQFNATYHELSQANEQNNHHRAAINHSERQINELKQKNMEICTEMSTLRKNTEKQYEQIRQQNNNLKIRLSSAEEKAQKQAEECSEWLERFEQASKECRKMQSECNRVSRSYLEQSNKKNKQNSRQVQNFKAQIKVLQEENSQLQQVMDRQLSKRKAMIEELIQQKKVLYEQLSRH